MPVLALPYDCKYYHHHPHYIHIHIKNKDSHNGFEASGALMRRHCVSPGSELRFGREDAPVEQQVRLAGLNIEMEHAIVTNAGGVITLAKAVDGAKVFLNGEALTAPTALHHMDRIIFGNNHVYLVRSPSSDIHCFQFVNVFSVRIHTCEQVSERLLGCCR